MPFGSCAIGVDIGNTKLAVGLVDERGAVLKKVRKPTDTTLDGKGLVSTLIDMIDQVLSSYADAVLGVGIGFGGLVDVSSGYALSSPNHPAWGAVDLCGILGSKYDLPAAIDNDANAAALAEKWCGAGVDRPDFAYITVSTGCGGAIVIDNRLYHGTYGYAGEIGHITVDPDGPICSCGRRGCLEAFVSGRSIAKAAMSMVRQHPDRSPVLKERIDSEVITAEDIYAAAEAGDGLALEAFETAGKYLGIGIANLVNILDLPLVILGGGVIRAREFIFPAMWREVGQRVVRNKPVEIIPTPLGDDVGVVGAAAVILKKLGLLAGTRATRETIEVSIKGSEGAHSCNEDRGSIHEYIRAVSEAATSPVCEELGRVSEALLMARSQGKTVFLVGNGGSAANASHLANDLMKGLSIGGKKRFKVQALCDSIPLLTALANDISYDDVFIEQLKNHAGAGDVLICISGSGNSENVVRAARFAREIGCRVISFTGARGGRLRELSDICCRANTNVMEQIEDIHLIWAHALVTALRKIIEAE